MNPKRVRSRGPVRSKASACRSAWVTVADGLLRTDSELAAHVGNDVGRTGGGMVSAAPWRNPGAVGSTKQAAMAVATPQQADGDGPVARCGDASGRSGRRPTSTLEGNEAHGRRGRASSATAVTATDPQAEQSLEVEGRCGDPGSPGVPRRRDDEEARATVMWRGCQRGDFFEGCEGAVGEAPAYRTSSAPRIRPGGSTARWRRSGRRVPKRCEPLPVPGCNKPGTRSRSKPPRWCKTTRAEPADRTGIRPAHGGNTVRGRCDRTKSEEGHITE